MQAQTEQEFIQWMADYLKAETSWGKIALKYAGDVYYSFIESDGIEFGDDRYRWDREAAIEICKTDMSYWED